ncbi:hypothetical protein [Flavobacterium salmonis]|uniref:Uncharacterized protein n=1 Tax=Flavobacterium salmonis TaxID=2654844 RepID=A0A6V6ZBB1_9FLAO|nr:hypothetical protein [Flavobacterium salmonis]CAD0009097.1 hypothetical protein FLAT13_04742 [Flavobacterium salmonis]
MIQSNYIKIFTTAVYHTYFDNTKCNCLDFIANHKTEKILKRFGFKINTIYNGFDLFSTTSSLSNLFDYISKTTTQNYFEFDIRCSNPNFILFTALPINWLGEIIFDSHDDKNQNNNGITTLSPTLETKSMAPFFGSLKIYFADILKNQTTTPFQFEIKFKARATQWQYYFINKNAVTLNNPAITEKENIQFDGPQQVTLQTGEKALLFTSSTTNILLSEKPKYKFDLINKNTSNGSGQSNLNGKVIIKGLPVPDVSRIEIVKNSKTNQIASPMYIYL